MKKGSRAQIRKERTIDHFHYDVTHAKFLVVVVKIAPRVAQSRGKFKIIHKTCNAMAAELVDRITSIMSIIERTSSDISDKPAFTPPGHINRQHCKSKEALFCNIFDFFDRLYARFSGR